MSKKKKLFSGPQTMRKQGRPMLPALSTVFLGRPLPVAWGISAALTPGGLIQGALIQS